MLLSLLLGVGPFQLRFNQAFEHVVYVPASSESLRLSQLHNNLIGSRATQRVHVDPGYPTKQFPDLPVRLLVPFLVTLSVQRAPKGAIGSVEMLLDGSSAHRQYGRVLIANQLLLAQNRIQSVELQNQLILFWRQLLINT